MPDRKDQQVWPKRRPRPKESGFSLAEVMIAVAIFSVGMLGVGTMLMASLQNDRFNRSKRYAEDIATDIAERFRARNPDTWPDEGTRRYIFHPHSETDELDDLDDTSAMIYDWKFYKCRGCKDKYLECVDLTESFSCDPGIGTDEMDDRMVEIWVGWGNIMDPSADMDPLGVCQDQATAKCRKKRVRVTTYVPGS